VLDWVEFDPTAPAGDPSCHAGAVRVRAYLSAAVLAARADPDRWAVAEAVVGRPSPH
jgi:hypothetical protein